MKVGQTHLTYCSNIHPGESWPRVLSNLENHALAVRQLVRPGDEFGIGLRLSAQAARTLEQPEAIAEFQAFLRSHGLYVFTLNGFPYGPFHGRPVKAAVYQPDWTRAERGDYTRCLIRILSQLKPAGVNGSISTVPGGFKRDITTNEQRGRIVQQLHQQVVNLYDLARSHGHAIMLALEPEPCCLLETTEEAVSFFERELLEPGALQALAKQLKTGTSEAETALRTHLGICLDACHAAVEFEEPSETLAKLRASGLRIAKVQASTGLRLTKPSSAMLAALQNYAEPVYLHQVVVASQKGALLRFEDLPEALASQSARRGREWRVHFHVPLYQEALGAFTNTQGYLAELLKLHRACPITEQIEVETYTWDVLPEEQRHLGLEASIARELSWVEERL